MNKYKPTYKHATIALVIAFIGLPMIYSAYRGVSPILDDIAQSRIDIPLQDANCIADFNEQMQGLKLQ